MVRASFSIGFPAFEIKSRSFRTQARPRANQIGPGRNPSEFVLPSSVSFVQKRVCHNSSKRSESCRAAPTGSATIAGSGEIQQTREQARRLGIVDRVELPGWLGPSETAALLQRTDILALPSFVESLPMVVIEAFAYGVAVVATPVGAVPEVIAHDRNGLLVPVGDVEALADALNQLLEDGALRRRLGDAARRDHAERYEINNYITRLASIWRKAARCRKPETLA